jgi:hypothetical protein
MEKGSVYYIELSKHTFLRGTYAYTKYGNYVFHSLVKVTQDLETSFDPNTLVAFCPQDFFISDNLNNFVYLI